MNRRLGWVLLIAALAWGAWADPHSLLSRDAPLIGGSILAARTHAWLVALGFSHLLLAWVPLPEIVRRKSSTFTGLGTALSFVSLLVPTLSASLALRGMGALLNCVGGFLAFRGGVRLEEWRRRRMGLVAIGFLIDLCLAVALLREPDAAYAITALSVRLMTLARMAAVALPLLAALSEEWEAEPSSSHGPAGWLDPSAYAMTLVLLSAGATPWLKYLLPFPAVGATIGLWQAALRPLRHARWTTLFWLLVATSVTAGLLAGLFAFEGPFPAPTGMNAYEDLLRRLARHAHINLIMTGIVGLALAHPQLGGRGRPATLAVALLLTGAVLTAGLPFVRGMTPTLLAVGPLMQVAGVVLGIWPMVRRNPGGGTPVCSGNGPPSPEPP